MSSPTAGATSSTAVASAATTESSASKSEQQQHALPSAADFEPPLACVRRILKNTLPSSTNVGKDASAAFARAAGIFIIYLTACANDFAREHKRQTITANDVLAAVKELDFGEFAPEMLQFLETYRRGEKSKKDAKAAAAASSKKGEEEDEDDGKHAAAASEDEEEEDDEDHPHHHPDPNTADKKRDRGEDASEEVEEPVIKRAKATFTSSPPDGGDGEF